MQITGYKIMDMLDMLKERAQALDSSFTTSIYAFEDEDKPNPVEVMGGYESVQDKIAQLQELQSRYNIAVMLDFDGRQISLERAIKLQGIMSRLKNQWAAAAKLEPGTGRARHPYYYEEQSDFTRSKDTEVAKRQVSRQTCDELADKYTRLAQKLKALVRAGNAQTMELDADPVLFEA